MATFQRHVFICVNQRPSDDPKGCCAAKGGAGVADAFKKKLYARGLKRLVRSNKAYCLDQCARGVTVVVYPDGVWYGGVTLEDVDEIIERHVIGGEIVARLRIPPEELTGIGPEVKTIREAAEGE
jgi:(2Fe-2S) ferredoxin